MDTPLTSSGLLLNIKDRTGFGEIAIARRLNVSQSTVNRILHGKSDCKSSTLIAIQQWWAELATAGEPQ